jgi:excisionase family DNA binding protein
MTEATARQVNVELWLTKAECAARLACSEKTIERLVRRGQLHRRTRHRTGKKRMPVYSPDDIGKIQEQNARAAPGAPGTALAAIGKQRGDVLALFTEALERRNAPATPQAPNAYLTVDQAAAYIGRTTTFIRRAIKDKSLPAVRDGGWRIRKADLEKL